MKRLTTKDNLQVIYEDNHIIVINKRAGDLVQGDKTRDTPLADIVKGYIKEKYQKPGNVYLGVVHRLDRPTTGIVLFAKTSKALPRLNKLFKEKEARKTYLAITKVKPPQEKGTLEHWMKRNPKQNKSYANSKEVPDSKKAILHYEVLKALNNYHLIEIDLETGRHHQIRSQLSVIGCPIKGDLKYGFDRSNKDGSIHLHAHTLSLMHPVKKEQLTFTAPLPDEPLWNACR
ncbi:RluA family pseudouridine synthase [Galbibacter sp.]|uniref:RluA family pseudouridine synthase n=1 Tax=Galbibacter sp. TaxID=2918471 RepID=UPI003A905D2D